MNRERTGDGLSIQAWHLVPKIREVDAVVRSSPECQGTVAEAHPELCFAALGDDPIAEPKSTAAGRAKRLDRLRSRIPDVENLYEACLDAYLRKEVKRDDVLDALVLALAASRPLVRVPPVPDEETPRDSVGLPMAIHYPETGLFDNDWIE